MLQQAIDFRDECEAVFALIDPLTESDFEKQTLFKNWTINDILQHLHFFNYAADLSLHDETQFTAVYSELKSRQEKTSMVEATHQMLDGLCGRALLQAWRDYYLPMSARFEQADPKARVKWAGPDMSVRSSITARLMETWSHAQAIYDLLAVTRVDGDRIKNVAVLGVNTFGWTFINRGESVPANKPFVRLTAPSGELWQWNEPSGEQIIEGAATEFCQVVTQTRNIADTSLQVTGAVATQWMLVAQCFAGPPREPPAAGTRRSS